MSINSMERHLSYTVTCEGKSTYRQEADNLKQAEHIARERSRDFYGLYPIRHGSEVVCCFSNGRRFKTISNAVRALYGKVA